VRGNLFLHTQKERGEGKEETLTDQLWSAPKIKNTINIKERRLTMQQKKRKRERERKGWNLGLLSHVRFAAKEEKKE